MLGKNAGISQIIKKKKLEGANKVNPSGLSSIEAMLESEVPKTKKVNSTEVPTSDKVPTSNFSGAKKMSGEDSLKIDTTLQKSKSDKKVNAYDPKLGNFEVEQDDKGYYKETGEEKKKKLLESLKRK
jgi:hypothetical protein